MRYQISTPKNGFYGITAKVRAVFALFIMLLIFTACDADTPSGYDGSLQNDSQATQPIAEINIPEQTEQPTAEHSSEPTERPTSEHSPEPTEQPATPSPGADTGFFYMELYAPIINAYAKLEQSSFMMTEANLISESLLEIQLDWGIQVSESLLNNRQWIPYKYGWDELPTLMYSLEGMSGSPELLIGVKSNGVIEVISIYAIVKFDSRSDTEPDNYGAGVRNVFSVANRDIISVTLTRHDNGSRVVTTTWHGDVGETYEYFQVVGAGIGVGWLDFIKTTDSQQRYSACYTGNCGSCDGGFIRITEEEYLAQILRFGTAGHNLGGNVEARHINLEWKPIHSGTSWE